ncbi:hypothetical protein AMS68_007483 [Peltaster fructicola]|uniref:RING-type domain-containing protein n=1 Tax=Peltaster fructicola TaxID=286661 RepID=A0A6H0Y4S4_9PEZI|nr:hypothetical protein AMS68_007483 [Peltaster fructicola]
MAIDDEAEYPAHWGQCIPDYTRLRDVLGADLYSRYNEKTIEYACPVTERVFCARTDPPRRPQPCQHFVGQWNSQKLCIRCEKCMWYTCMRCEESFSTSSSSGRQAAIDHQCDPSREQEIIQRALQGLERGKDYQICPNEECGRPWALWDGCNHMRCTCKTYFCFICGAKIHEHYKHFERTDDCPLYGQPGDLENPRPRPGNLADEDAARQIRLLMERGARLEEEMAIREDRARRAWQIEQIRRREEQRWAALEAIRRGRVRAVAANRPEVQVALDRLQVREHNEQIYFVDHLGIPFNPYQRLHLGARDIQLFETPGTPHRERLQRRRREVCSVM